MFRHQRLVDGRGGATRSVSDRSDPSSLLLMYTAARVGGARFRRALLARSASLTIRGRNRNRIRSRNRSSNRLIGSGRFPESLGNLGRLNQGNIRKLTRLLIRVNMLVFQQVHHLDDRPGGRAIAPDPARRGMVPQDARIAASRAVRSGRDVARRPIRSPQGHRRRRDRDAGSARHRADRPLDDLDR